MTTTRRLNKWDDLRLLQARARRIIKLREAGLTWLEIGRLLDVSKQRAFQIWKACEENKGPYAGLRRTEDTAEKPVEF